MVRQATSLDRVRSELLPHSVDRSVERRLAAAVPVVEEPALHYGIAGKLRGRYTANRQLSSQSSSVQEARFSGR